jgi:hypothetical protein
MFDRKEYKMSMDNSEIRRFSIREHPRILVNNDFGSIHVKGESQGNEVSVQATQRNWILIGETAAPAEIHYEQNNDANSVTITVERAGSGFSVTEIILNITVPWYADLNLATKAGSIDVTTVTGQMSLHTNAGSITVRQSTLGGNSTVQTNAGSVTFEGAIDPQWAYQFMTNTGSVHVVLPLHTAFHVDARTDIGSITTNVPGVLVTRLNYMNSEAHGEVGNPPRGTITLRSTLGSIYLQQTF